MKLKLIKTILLASILPAILFGQNTAEDQGDSSEAENVVLGPGPGRPPPRPAPGAPGNPPPALLNSGSGGYYYGLPDNSNSAFPSDTKQDNITKKNQSIPRP